MVLGNKLKRFYLQPGKKMYYSEFLNILSSLLNYNSKIIQISGTAGSGKSTLAQYIVGNMVAPTEDPSGVLWINASSGFSNKRLEDIFGSDPFLFSKVKERIFIANALTYFDQQLLFNTITSENYVFPSDIKFIVIDSISRNFRVELAKYTEINVRAKLINKFFSEQIYPLVMLASRLNASLVLIHESSYKPNIEKNVKFLHDPFERIDAIDIELAQNDSEEKQIYLKYHNVRFSSFYRLSNNGFEFMI